MLALDQALCPGYAHRWTTVLSPCYKERRATRADRGNGIKYQAQKAFTLAIANMIYIGVGRVGGAGGAYIRVRDATTVHTYISSTL